MNKKIWELFKLTGDIKYYLMYKKLEDDEIGENKDKRSSSTRSKL